MITTVRHPSARWRPVALIIGLALLIGGGLVWLLSLFQIIAAPGANILSTGFAILGAILALLQWLWPMSPVTGNTLTRAIRRKATLQVKVRDELCGSTIYADRGFHACPPQADLAANVIEQRNGNQTEFIAEFFEMEPTNYTISINSQEPTARITLIPGRLTVIDWRHIQP